jgi:hypothetical protein
MHVEPAESGCRNIILEEDPQRPVECLDNDADEGGAVGDGLGDEDTEPNEGDEDGDELDSDGGQFENGDEDSPRKPMSAVLPMPPWLLELFKAHISECGSAF